jgi:uncharacterized membrane protein
MMYGWNGGFGGMPLYGGLLMIVVWVGVVALVIWALRALLPGDRRSERRSERAVALELLTRRYDAGEISAIEYEQARHAIDA